MSGPAEQQFLTVSRRHSALTRVVVVLLVEALALLITPAGRVWPAAAALLAGGVWSAFYLLRLRGRAIAWVLWCDVAAISAACLAQGWLDLPRLVADGSGWVQMAMLTAVAAHQWQLPDAAKTALVAVAAVPVVAFGAGTWLMSGPSLASLLVRAIWPAIVATVSAAIFSSLRGAARRVDVAAAGHERAMAEADVAAARRAAKSEQLAALHDTAAATLMMVGLGRVDDGDPWLSGQAGRDLDVLTGGPHATADSLGAGLCSVADATGLAVRIKHARTARPATAPAAVEAALLGAAGEALRNVARHAGVAEARILLDQSDAGIRLEVCDTGTGFVEHATLRAGRGIRHSIIERMERVGGRATITSSAAGVTVRLEWPDE